MRTFRNLLEEIVSLGGGNLATFDAPIASSPVRRFGPAKVYDVKNLNSITKNVNGKKKYKRWTKTFESDDDHTEIKREYQRTKNDIIIHEPKSGIMVYLRKKG